MSLRAKLTLIIIAVCAVALAMSRESIYSWMGDRLVALSEPQVSDAIVIAGGADGKREVLGAELLNKGLAPRIILTGARAGWRHTIPGIMEEHLEALGVDGSKVTVQVPTESDSQAAARLKHVAKERDWTTLLIVAAPMESRRIKEVYSHYFPGPYHRVTVTAYREDEYGPHSWWTSPSGRRVVLGEWGRLLARRLHIP